MAQRDNKPQKIVPQNERGFHQPQQFVRHAAPANLDPYQNPNIGNYNRPIQGVPPQQQPAGPNKRYLSSLQRELVEAQQIINHHKRDPQGLNIEPHGMSFATQNPHEKIYVFLRRHWSENFSWIITNFLYALAPFIGAIIFALLDIEISFLGVKEYIIILLCYYSLIVTNIIKDYFDWYYDPYIITNQRIIHYEFKPFTKYEVKEAALESVENVSEISSGLLAGLWGYGSLRISTEAYNDVFVFERIPRPTKVRDILFDLTKIARKYSGSN